MTTDQTSVLDPEEAGASEQEPSTPPSDFTSRSGASLVVERARDRHLVREAQKLRWTVFADEQGARILTPEPGYDIDPLDDYCRHILVRDVRTGHVVACTRILYQEDADRAGGFYSESEFDLTAIRRAPGRTMEMGRTCVHPEYRKTVTISLLWTGIAQYTAFRDYARIIGCASIPMRQDRGAGALAVYHDLMARCPSPQDLRVVPKHPLPDGLEPVGEPKAPPLLMAYVRYGAVVCGPPCWDPGFDTADLLMMLPAENVGPRYLRRFVERKREETGPNRDSPHA
jgi:putative hemolysin